MISSLITITAVRISLGGDSFNLHCIVDRNIVGLRVKFDAPLTGLNSPAILAADRSKAAHLCDPYVYLFVSYLYCDTFVPFLLFLSSTVSIFSFAPCLIIFILPLPSPILGSPSPVPLYFVGLLINQQFVLFNFLVGYFFL
jgi:hypothetical protein